MSIFKQVELSLCHADLPGNVSWSIWEPRGAVFRWLGFPGVWGWVREAEKTLGRTEALLQFPGHCPPGAGHQNKRNGHNSVDRNPGLTLPFVKMFATSNYFVFKESTSSAELSGTL